MHWHFCAFWEKSDQCGPVVKTIFVELKKYFLLFQASFETPNLQGPNASTETASLEVPNVNIEAPNVTVREETNGADHPDGGRHPDGADQEAPVYEDPADSISELGQSPDLNDAPEYPEAETPSAFNPGLEIFIPTVTKDAQVSSQF